MCRCISRVPECSHLCGKLCYSKVWKEGRKMARRTDKEERGAEVSAECPFSIFVFIFIRYLVWEWVYVRLVWCEVWCVLCVWMVGVWGGQAGRLVVRTSIFSKRSLCFPGTSAECLAVKLVELLKLSLSLFFLLSFFFFPF
ncbi:hypothetical protein HOY80DRAFT_947042 [Tuber brumale]|nr:hypothetical protein HOY80DRAFT_947042 [Tuber brumale]